MSSDDGTRRTTAGLAEVGAAGDSDLTWVLSTCCSFVGASSATKPSFRAISRGGSVALVRCCRWHRAADTAARRLFCYFSNGTDFHDDVVPARCRVRTTLMQLWASSWVQLVRSGTANGPRETPSSRNDRRTLGRPPDA